MGATLAQMFIRDLYISSAQIYPGFPFFPQVMIYLLS
jgi:hypothetical protein